MTPVMVVVLLVCLGLIVLGIDFDLIHMQWHGLLRTVIDSSVERGLASSAHTLWHQRVRAVHRYVRGGAPSHLVDCSGAT